MSVSDSMTSILTKEDLYSHLNLSIFGLLKKMPSPLQEPAALFLMKYSGSKFNPGDFLAKYPKPVWTLLYYLHERKNIENERFFEIAKAHGIALFLHSLDDHLIDGDIKPDLLMLQLRTTAWMSYYSIVNSYEDESHAQSVNNFIDEYCSGVFNFTCNDLEGFLNSAKNESGIWKVAPALLLSDKHDREILIDLIDEFITAYRIYDDLDDWRIDAKAGAKSSVYYCLNEPLQNLFLDCQNWKKSGELDILGTLAKSLKTSPLWKDLVFRGKNALTKCADHCNELQMPDLGREVLEFQKLFEKEFIND